AVAPVHTPAVVAGAEGPIHHRPHTAIAVGRAAVRPRADLLQDGQVGRPVISPVRPGPAHVVGRPPRDPQDVADHREGQAGHRADALRNAGFFYRPPGPRGGSRPPSSCGPAPARAPGSWRTPPANWLAGTTSSLACTAVVAPASANRFQLRNHAGRDVELTAELSDRLLSVHNPLYCLPPELRSQ